MVLYDDAKNLLACLRHVNRVHTTPGAHPRPGYNSARHSGATLDCRSPPMMDDSLTAELERLKAENERLPRARGRTVSLKISEKGGVSVSGLGRFPVTLY